MPFSLHEAAQVEQTGGAEHAESDVINVVFSHAHPHAAGGNHVTEIVVFGHGDVIIAAWQQALDDEAAVVMRPRLFDRRPGASFDAT